MNLPDFTRLPWAIAIDLDGTLLAINTQLSERNHKAIEKCLAEAIPVIIATSRPARIFHRIFPNDLAASCSLIIMNGAIAIGKPPLSGYFKEPLPDPIIRGIIDLATRFDPDIRITLELDGYEFGTNWMDPSDTEALWQRNSATPDMVLTFEEAMLKQPCKIALGGLGTDILKLVDELNNNFGEIISVVPALLGNPLLNITTREASKPSALRKLLSPLNISLEEVLAFGDDHPDIEMLQECGISVAMSNAFPEVKAVCSYQTASNDEDGVALVLERLFPLF